MGVSVDLDSGPTRTWAVVGSEGLAPYRFEFEPTLYVRDGGHVAGRVTGSYDLLLTQRLIVQPEAELNFYSKDDPSRQIGSGLSDLEDRKSTRLNSSHQIISYAVFCLKKKTEP